MCEGEQLNHDLARLSVVMSLSKRLERPGISRAWKKLIAIDQVSSAIGFQRKAWMTCRGGALTT
jgi:hypothetical protein